MDTWTWLAVSNAQALRFFFERLKDVIDDPEAPTNELLYNASVLAHFATSSTATLEFPATPTGLDHVFDLFVMDRSQHTDPGIMEAAGSQCLLLTGFFQDQQRRRHNVEWYATLGAGFYDSAAHHVHDRARMRMMETMAVRFGYWRRQQQRLARELRDLPKLIRGAEIDRASAVTCHHSCSLNLAPDVRSGRFSSSTICMSNLRLLDELLQEEGYRVLRARDGEEALEIVEAGEPDLVLSDVRMPKCDGFDFCRAMRSRAETRLTPVVLMTGGSEAEDRIRAIEAGAPTSSRSRSTSRN